MCIPADSSRTDALLRSANQSEREQSERRLRAHALQRFGLPADLPVSTAKLMEVIGSAESRFYSDIRVLGFIATWLLAIWFCHASGVSLPVALYALPALSYFALRRWLVSRLVREALQHTQAQGPVDLSIGLSR